MVKREVPVRPCPHGPVRYRKSADGREKVCVTCYGTAPTRVCPKCGHAPVTRTSDGGVCLDCGLAASWSAFLKFDILRERLR